MAATGIRCLMTLQDAPYGFTEVHVNTSTDFAVVRPRLIALFKARMALCGPPAMPFRGRMSKLGVRRQVAKLTADEIGAINTVPPFAQMVGPDGALGPNASDQAKSSVLLRAVGANGTEKSIFLAGIPDPVIGEVPPGPRIAFIPAYLPLFQAYRTRLLQDGWGYVGRVTDPAVTLPVNVVGYDIDGGNNLTQVVVVGVAANYPVGLRVMIRNVTMTNRAYKSPEGQWVVDKAVDNAPLAGQCTINLRNSLGVQINQVADKGTIEFVSFTTITYSDVYPEAQTARKRGNRILVGPGRRTIRAKISL
jgi:hypothetical protein